jgi:hypothetical protein
MDGAVDYWLTRFVLQKGLGLIYLAAFLVVVNQFRPLVGEHGLLPAPRLLKRVTFREVPSLFHWWPSDRAFALGGWLGVLLSLLATLGLSEQFGTPFSMLVWALLWVLYLSFVNIGQTFYGFGWESILLESGFLAIFLGAADTEPAVVTIWLLRWVLFRVMFGAGLIKLRGDPCWRDLTCLSWHFETQPLPNPLSWFFHRLPVWAHKTGVLFNHLVEVAVPFAYFAPQPISGIAGLVTILFQGSLIVSGNFSWLNHLTVVLAFSTLDGQFLARLLPLVPPALSAPPTLFLAAAWGVALVVAILSIQPVRNLWSKHQVMNTSYNPYHLVNSYGAFGSITRPRYEIILEGTTDLIPISSGDWRPYEFRAKPGDTRRRPPQIAPYHLRLDWLMWFAAMPGRPDCPLWLVHLVAKLLEGDTATLALLRGNPFGASPPRFIRARYYLYRFTTPAERRQTGDWWHRDLVGSYLEPLSLAEPEFRGILLRSGWRPSPQGAQHGAGGVIAAHAVDATTGGGGGRAQEEAGGAGGIGDRPEHRPGQNLPEILHAADDIAADAVRVVALISGGSTRMARQDQLAEPRREALHLRFDGGRHIDGRPVRDVAVGPAGLLAGRSAAGIEQALLGQQDEGPLRMVPPPDRRFPGRELLQGAAEMNGTGPRALDCPPGDRPGQGPVDLEHPRTVTVVLQSLPVAPVETVAGHRQQLSRGDIEEYGPGGRQLRQAGDRPGRLDPPAEGLQVAGQRRGDLPGATLGERPADGMRGHAEHQANRR